MKYLKTFGRAFFTSFVKTLGYLLVFPLMLVGAVAAVVAIFFSAGFIWATEVLREEADKRSEAE